jgi:3-oxoacyl-[acyl-carrier protein] reductase
MIDNSVMLITGTRKGLGEYLANYYAKKGIKVIGCSRGNVNCKRDNYEHYSLDVSDEAEVKKMFTEIRRKYGRLDYLINNAGINSTLAPILLVPYEAALNTLKVNFLGTFIMSREAVKLMKKNSFGRIINLGSMATKHEVKGEAIYTASKAAIISFTRVMAKEVFSFGVTCNVVAPSAISTDLMEKINREALYEVLNRNAIPDTGKPEDVSNTIDWLIKPESDSITGQTIFLGGA